MVIGVLSPLALSPMSRFQHNLSTSCSDFLGCCHLNLFEFKKTTSLENNTPGKKEQERTAQLVSFSRSLEGSPHTLKNKTCRAERKTEQDF